MGGRLGGWLRYDFFCFLFSIFVGYSLLCVDFSHVQDKGFSMEPEKIMERFEHADRAWEEAHHWTGHAAIYWARVVYALLSLPFLFYWLPGLQGVLTHTRMTGYNQNGACV